MVRYLEIIKYDSYLWLENFLEDLEENEKVDMYRFKWSFYLNDIKLIRSYEINFPWIKPVCIGATHKAEMYVSILNIRFTFHEHF